MIVIQHYVSRRSMWLQIINARHLRNCYPARPTNAGHRWWHFLPWKLQGRGHQSVQRQSSDFAFELRDEDRAEANVVVPVVGGVVVPISRPTVLGVVVPAPATNHTVRTHDWCPSSSTATIVTVNNFSEFSCIGIFCKYNQWHGVVYKLILWPSPSL